MMKRRIAALIALLLAGLLALSGCGKLAEVSSPAAKGPAETAAAEKAAEALTKAPTEAPTKAPKPTKAPTEAPTKAPKPTKAPTEAPEEKAGPIIEPQAIADYLFTYGKLPDNFITKKEAQALGWDSSYNYVSDVAPGKSIGGDRFGNYEGKLPKKKGRTYYECDCNYRGGKRGAERIIYSSDGRVWYTNDHYETFTELFPSK